LDCQALENVFLIQDCGLFPIGEWDVDARMCYKISQMLAQAELDIRNSPILFGLLADVASPVAQPQWGLPTGYVGNVDAAFDIFDDPFEMGEEANESCTKESVRLAGIALVQRSLRIGYESLVVVPTVRAESIGPEDDGSIGADGDFKLLVHSYTCPFRSANSVPSTKREDARPGEEVRNFSHLVSRTVIGQRSRLHLGCVECSLNNLLFCIPRKAKSN
jgi:hypothetical protein